VGRDAPHNKTSKKENIMEKHGPPSGGEEPCIYSPYITVKGVRRYHPTGGVFKIPINRLKKK